jgi:Tol biopolymer transport system component
MLLTGGWILWFMLVTIPAVAPLFTLSSPIGTQRVPLGEAPNGKIKIAFVSDLDGHNNIYVMNADGSGVRKLTHTTTEEEYILRWSPDGQKIAFMRRRLGSQEAGIYVMNADGSGQERITDDVLAFSQFTWSPDSQKIAFSKNDGVGTGDIYDINADGSRQIRLSGSAGDFEVYVGTPVWSPDAQKVTFIRGTFEVTDTASSAEASAPVYELSGTYVVNANGTGETKLNSSGSSSILAWSPGGEKIAFTQPGMNNNDVFAMDSDGSNITKLTSTPANELGPTWSPDGEKIAFTRDDALGTADIFVMNSDGTAQTRLTNTPGGEGIISWSPDGEKILFFAPDADANYFSDGLCVIDADGSNRRCPVEFADDVMGVAVIWTRAK